MDGNKYSSLTTARKMFSSDDFNYDRESSYL